MHSTVDVTDGDAPPATAGSRTTDRRARRRGWLAYVGPLAAVAVAVVAVGRFVTVGSSVHQRAGGSGELDDATTAAESTLDDLLAATRARPTDAAAWRDYGVAAVREAARRGDPAYYEVATSALARAAQLAPDDAGVLTARAALALGLHDFGTAQALARRAVEANPHSAQAVAALFDAQVELGHYDAAEETVRRLVALEPGGAAYARVSYLRQLHGDMAGAQLAMRQAVAATGSGAERAVLLVYLGDVSLEMGDLATARRAYDDAATQDPLSVPAELGHIRLLFASGARVEARSRLAALVQRSPQPAVAGLLVDVALLSGDRAGADVALELVRANHDLARANGVQSEVEAVLFEADHGDAVRAVDEARVAYAGRPTIFTADALAWALYRAGRPLEAVEHVRAALATGVTTPAIRIHAAAIYAEVGQLDEARVHLLVAFAGSPWLAPVLLPHAADLAARLGLTVPQGWSW